jgi:alkylated DNA repair dioxygenase AlkB
MTAQPDLFNNDRNSHQIAPNLPDGFFYRSEIISRADEEKLVARMTELPFKEFEFHGFLGKRRVISFGWRYDYSGGTLRKADEIPQWLLTLRQSAAMFADLEPEAFEQALVTEYAPRAGIGWHRDKAVFGKVVGISLLSECVFRLRRALAKGKWERVEIMPEPRSAYLLSGPVRTEWEHSVPPLDALRYAITFRTLREVGGRNSAA